MNSGIFLFKEEALSWRMDFASLVWCMDIRKLGSTKGNHLPIYALAIKSPKNKNIFCITAP